MEAGVLNLFARFMVYIPEAQPRAGVFPADTKYKIIDGYRLAEATTYVKSIAQQHSGSTVSKYDNKVGLVYKRNYKLIYNDCFDRVTSMSRHADILFTYKWDNFESMMEEIKVYALRSIVHSQQIIPAITRNMSLHDLKLQYDKIFADRVHAINSQKDSLLTDLRSQFESAKIINDEFTGWFNQLIIAYRSRTTDEVRKMTQSSDFIIPLTQRDMHVLESMNVHIAKYMTCLRMQDRAAKIVHAIHVAKMEEDQRLL
jgi:hypothetical protein